MNSQILSENLKIRILEKPNVYVFRKNGHLAFIVCLITKGSNKARSFHFNLGNRWSGNTCLG